MILIFSGLLIGGILLGQMVDFSNMRDLLEFSTAVCLAFIMIEVGLEFSIDKKKITTYRQDAFIAFMAAFSPALLCFLYFIFILKADWSPSALGAMSSAPTSAGILFTMMTAAGLHLTWVFKKARLLAILDDLATLILLIPLQILLHGFELQSGVVIILIAAFLFAAFRWQNKVLWPTTKGWLLFYALALVCTLLGIKNASNIHIEVLVPAFMGGCLLHAQKNPALQTRPKPLSLDLLIKGLFMVLVGLSLPKMCVDAIAWKETVGHVFALMVLSNLGKSFCLICYRKEASLKERLALSIAMFPRGEVGAAVLLIAVGYGFTGYVNTLAMLSLALNLMLSGIFIAGVLKLLEKSRGFSQN